MLFTVIVATYNAEKYIGRCLDSFLEQSFSDAELIVVDGDSSDNTKAIIAEHPAVSRWVSEPDRGIYDAWNKGIALSGGKWIVFLGADDYFENKALLTLSDACLKNPDLDYISGRVNLIDSNGSIFRTVGDKWRWGAFRHKMNTAHPGSAHNKRLFDECGQYNISYRIVGDYEFLLRKGEFLKAGFVDKVFVNMVVGGVSYMNPKALNERFTVKSEHRTESFVMNLTSLFLSYFKLGLKASLLRLGLIRG